MKEKTDWIQKAGKEVLHSSGPAKKSNEGSGEGGLLKAGLAIAAGLIIAALAKGVKDSDYYD